jgi:ribonuclease P/MRP protein subunit RPP40
MILVKPLRVDHTILVELLARYELLRYLVKWTDSFLRGRHFQVRVNGALSGRIPAHSGVPQGSVLGPLLFNLYVNRIPDKLKSDCLLFADDLKIWRSIQSGSDIVTLQRDIDTLLEVADDLKLPLNITKCQHLHIGSDIALAYHLGSHTIKTEPVVRDLGVLNSFDLKTKAHTMQAVKKGFRLLWALRRSFKFWTIETTPRLVNTFIRPLIEYGAPAYFPLTKGECCDLEKVQRTATRLVPALRGKSYLERCSALDTFTLEYRRTRMDLIFTFKVLCLKEIPTVEHIFVNTTNARTRGHPFKLEKQRMKKMTANYSLPARITNLWNNLPREIVEAPTVQRFKKLLDNHLWYDLQTWRHDPLPGEAYPRMPTPPHI